jgi:hypothetical protein
VNRNISEEYTAFIFRVYPTPNLKMEAVCSTETSVFTYKKEKTRLLTICYSSPRKPQILLLSSALLVGRASRSCNESDEFEILDILELNGNLHFFVYNSRYCRFTKYTTLHTHTVYYTLRLNNYRSRESVVGIAIGYGLDDRGVGVRVPVGSRIFSSPRRPDPLWGPPTLLSNGYQGLFPKG